MVAGELALGGIWDIARSHSSPTWSTHLGYPSYFLVLLGTWKVLGALAMLIPGRPLLKEWAYAGAFFTYTGAIVSHLTTGYALGEVGPAGRPDCPDRAVLGATALQPPDGAAHAHRTASQQACGTPGVAHHIRVMDPTR